MSPSLASSQHAPWRDSAAEKTCVKLGMESTPQLEGGTLKGGTFQHVISASPHVLVPSLMKSRATLQKKVTGENKIYTFELPSASVRPDDARMEPKI